MKAASILNHVLGPIMRGPSSSHTAGAHHIARLLRDLLGEEPVQARIRFDPSGSYAHTYSQQGADRAFVAGLRGRTLIDDRFFSCLTEPGLDVNFLVEPIPGADHPNTVEIELTGRAGGKLQARAASIGGGEVNIQRIDGWNTRLDGTAYEAIVEGDASDAESIASLLASDGATLEPIPTTISEGRAFFVAHRNAPLAASLRRSLQAYPDCRIRESRPVYFLQTGSPLFTSAQEMLDLAEAQGASLGRLALAYEAQRLDLPESHVIEEMVRRYRIMQAAVAKGLDPALTGMQLLEPSAHSVMAAQRANRLAVGGIHAEAAAKALAVMHVNSSMGVVCAAPTGGSAGTIPGVIVTLSEARNLPEEESARLLLAAGLVGVFVSNRATFAAEVAGCQVEIGAAGAMAAAAVVEAAGGTARQAADAAAIAFQNTMGSVCDLVQAMVEIPCHTRNAVAASSAFVCADLILGGYRNPVPLDETIDAVYSVGRMLPPELRCTAKGGLALAPSAQCLQCHRV
jgi:L-serine dehydratase